MPNLDILPTDGVSVARAAALSGLPRRQILRLIGRGEIVGAHKLDGLTGAWIVPASEIDRIATPSPERGDAA